MKARVAASLLLAMLVSGDLARAGEGVKPSEDERAKTLFSSGAQAYASGQFAAAIQAFAEANRVMPTPAIVYSLAQAHRRQYFIDRNPDHLQKAIANFHGYIEHVANGGRRADAVQALSELEPLVARMDEPPWRAGPKAGPSRGNEEPARLMITTQPSGAQVSIDGKRAWTSPYAAEVTPGKHRVHVTLDGYFEEDREVLAVDHVLVPVPLELRERPARLTIWAPKGGVIAIDGQTVGIAPRSEPFQVVSGRHEVTVTKNGYQTFSREISFRRNEARTLSVELHPTGQRILARWLMIGGGALIAASGAFVVLALKQQQEALDVQEAQKTRLRGPSDEGDYRDALEGRDRWRMAAIGAFSVGGAALVGGLVLHAFDPRTPPPPRAHLGEQGPRAPGPLEPVEMSVVPTLGPSVAGLTLKGRF
ncbi:PEGA domain-containing protein [Pendulispora rubella]|uniref:PEGA domain-containing protein n=1 Tax=Pendulispora rubella TaxID=2741070 RepID=A0ABZ2L7C2_9BACT